MIVIRIALYFAIGCIAAVLSEKWIKDGTVVKKIAILAVAIVVAIIVSKLTGG